MMKKLLLLSIWAAGCQGSMQPGTLEVAIYGEELIEQGIPAAVVVDGWAIEFSRFDVRVGEVTAAAGHGAPALTALDYSTFDLTLASDGQGQLVAAGAVEGGAYDHIEYRIESMHVAGTAARSGVTKSFAWDLTTPTRYGHCEGTAVVDGAVARTLLTIHADHLFYDDLVSASPDVAFDLIAGADDRGDGDGTITRAELEAVDITGQERYQVGNATEVTDLWTFIDRQSSSVGHIDGEGHCGQTVRE